jgi:hypothetical protein
MARRLCAGQRRNGAMYVSWKFDASKKPSSRSTISGVPRPSSAASIIAP